MKNRPIPAPEELWQPLDWPAWFIVLGERNKLLGRLSVGIAETAEKAVSEYLRRNPILASRLSAADRALITALPDTQSRGTAA
jgi:hypothetical protein